ncbi:MAG: hypothetical protein A2V99_02955 [Spirochaetes bacterium RBG_16_67_19]|nr:MAG: hypothetical protein A2V99_02955 [Spirochaetes bacterium RBG_16_67_19]
MPRIAPNGGNRNMPTTMPMMEPQIPPLPAPHFLAMSTGQHAAHDPGGQKQEAQDHQGGH